MEDRCAEIEHMQEDNAVLRQQLEEKSAYCDLFPELKTENDDLKENLQECRCSSEKTIAKLKQELRDVNQISDVKQSPAYIELKASKDGLEEKLEECCKVIQLMEEENVDLRSHLEERFQLPRNLLDSHQCPRCAELEDAKKTLEERVATLVDQVRAQEEVTEAILGSAHPQVPPSQPQPPQAPTTLFQALPNILSAKAWRRGRDAPYLMEDSNSTSAVSNNFEVCCCVSNLIFSYRVTTDTWRELPKLPLNQLGDLKIVFHEDISLLLPIKVRSVYSIRSGQWCKYGELRLAPWAILHYNKHLVLLGSQGQLRRVRISNNVILEVGALITSPTFCGGSTVINRDT